MALLTFVLAIALWLAFLSLVPSFWPRLAVGCLLIIWKGFECRASFIETRVRLNVYPTSKARTL